MTIKKSSVSSLVLLFSLGAALQPIATFLSSPSVGAQSVNFALPSSVPSGTTLQIDGSTSMDSLNQSLKQRFEQQYPGTKVNINTVGSTAGLQALLDGKADLAAIGRPLTDPEKAQGLVAVPVARDKIAIVVGANHSLSKGLDINQFAKIFRGEIKNWSQVGGAAGPIRLVDRPAENDTRQAFRSYPAFKNAPFETGAAADKLNDESTAAVIQKLGKDGISYLAAHQVQGQAGVKAVAMHGVAPTNSKYPFSQALFYVYRAANPPSTAVQAFLGYTAAKAGQEAIKASGVEAIAPIVSSAKAATLSTKPTDSTNGNPNAAANAGVNKTAKNSNSNKAAALNAPASSQTAETPGGKTALQPPSGATSEPEEKMPSWWWLLPLSALAGLLWMLGKERSRPTPQPYSPPTDGYSNNTDFSGGFDPHRSQPELNGGNSRLQPLDSAATVEGAGAQSYLDDDRDITPTQTSPDRPWGVTGESSPGSVAGSPDSLQPSANLAAGAAIAGGAGAAAWSFLSGNPAQSGASPQKAPEGSATQSTGLDNLPPAETEGQISLLPRSAEWATLRWNVPRSLRADAPRQGGERLVVRLYDVTGLDAEQTPDRFQQFDCDDLALSCNVPLPSSDRTYLAEIGYLSAEDHWTRFARSTPVWVPATTRMG